MTDAEIEAVACSVYEGRNGRGCKPWSRLTRAHQDPYREDARAAISALDRVRGTPPADAFDRWIEPFIAGEDQDD